MSLHFSANQFEEAYLPQRLGNWQVPKTFAERPRPRQGTTRPISDASGRFKDDFGLKSFGSNRNAADSRFQSAPLPTKSGNPLFVAGSAVASAKPFRSFKSNAGRKGPSEGPTSLKIQNYFPPGKEESKQATNQDQEDQDDSEPEGDQVQAADGTLRPEGFFVIKPALPDDPRKAAAMLAARQKNHRPLPDVNVESRDALIPRNWNGGIQPSAVTVDTSKAKGPTACTKRQVIRLNPESQAVERRPNVMELAIKWEAHTPPPSAGRIVRTKAAPPPVERTLHWLYENPVRDEAASKRSVDKSTRSKEVEAVHNQQAWLTNKEESAKSRDSGVSLRSRHSSNYGGGGQPEASGQPEEIAAGGGGGGCADRVADSDQESGYNSPRSSRGLPEGSPHLYDLDPVVKATRKSLSPPKNHFVVSSAFSAKMNRDDPNANYLPEYPLQRRETPPRQRSVAATSSPAQVKHAHRPPAAIAYNRTHRANIDEYPPQRSPSPPVQLADYADHAHHHHDTYRTHHQASCPAHDADQHAAHHMSLPTHREEAELSHGPHTVPRYGGDQDSGFGDREPADDQLSHDQQHFSHRQQQHQPVHQHGDKCGKHRSRPCVACQYTPTKGKGQVPVQTFKTAFKAGTTANKTTDDLNQIMKRRQGYKAPKPPPLTSHARFIRGTLAPPLSMGCRTDPIVQYPDFKRLDSTYRLSYGAHHHQFQSQHHTTPHHRNRTKTLTALLNEKSSRVWKS